MKKWIYICGAVVIAAAVLVLALLIKPQDTPGTPTEPPTAPSETLPPKKAQVVLYQCDAQLAAVWQELAQAYTAQTGTAVTVLTGKGGTCADDLAGLMASGNAPTLFCLHNRTDLKTWQPHCLDLTGSVIADSLCSQDLALTADGGIWGVAANVESYGLIYNTNLLARAGYTADDIETFTQLKNVVLHITADKKANGFSAFATPNLKNTSHGSLLCLLAGLSRDPDALRIFWDLYSSNCNASAALAGNEEDAAYQEFLQGKAVFFLGGTWIYDEFAEMDDYNLRILPVYTDDAHQDLGLYSHCTAYWCVNAGVDEIDRQAALDFLAWLVTAQEEQAAPVDSLQLLSPYRDAVYTANPLEEVVREYMRDERTGIEWRDCDNLAPETLAALGDALAAYAAAPDDSKWDAVLQILSAAE